MAEASNLESESKDRFPQLETPPISRIVLYRSGVAQIQHETEITDNARIEISFSAREVDDALKSLMFSDEGGGFVSAVEFQAAPAEEELAAIDLGSPMTLAQLLQLNRGERVNVSLTVSNVREEFSGTIIWSRKSL